MKKNKIIIGAAVLVVVLISFWFIWNFMIPSQDMKKNIKDMQADAVGLERKITHTLYDGTKKIWECKTKIYPFPAQGGGSAFSFIDKDGKK
ncbi:Uncharacterized protein dnl_05310 [Desulfonema limicola]|uniref:Uncharacterized protein n=1 Tax=Desulfonema limicola TaxID=45656 RepID=A0A975B3V3_9BACT|nr:hypothetical protein [Desulfonema limicola]QTA78310.1 Uncharacterized protein dnl_05310 [Desulfonema limicola]